MTLRTLLINIPNERMTIILKNTLYFIFVLLLITMLQSCNLEEKKKEFIQPEVLIEGAKFDLTKLNFNEEILTLLSKSLDTINNEYTIKDYEKAAYPTSENREAIISNKKYTYLDEKRYHFKALELDSIVQFLGLNANKIEFETDFNLNIQACWATAKVYDTLVLDTALYKMFAYGKDIWDQDYEFGTVLTEVTYVNYDADRNPIHKTKYEPRDSYLESGLYYYKHSPHDHYTRWVLKDKVIQIKISNGVETDVNFSTGSTESKDYYHVEFLICTKKEYKLVREKLIRTSTKNNFPMQILKPYYIEDLDFYTNFSRYYRGESKNGEKIYEFY